MSDTNRATLLKLATEAREAKQIGAIEFLRVRRVCQPRVWNRLDTDAKQTIGQQIEAFVAEKAIVAGVIVGETQKLAAGEINWDELLDFLKELLPLILEFIEALMVLF
jgi:hypothetical protein